MNKYLKQLASVGAGLLLCGSAMAQNSVSTIHRYLPLITGYNVYVQTNTTPGLGVTNTLYTTYNGQIVYSLTNNSYNGSAVNTNLIANDAFNVGKLATDINGDINANAAVYVYCSNTNWIPIAITNSVGQWFVPATPYTTNYSTAAWATVWPLASAQSPNWMYPATTNTYPNLNGTNLVTVNLYAGPSMNPQGGYGPTIGPNVALWETTPSFSFSFTTTGGTPVGLFTNLPTSFLQHAKNIYATVSVNTTNNGVLLNTIGILQPQ